MLKQLCRELEFPSAAIENLMLLNQRITQNNRLNKMLWQSLADYEAEGEAHIALLEQLSGELGASVYEVHLVFLLHGALHLRQKYAQNGLPDALFVETMQDLRYKLIECHQVYGVWGIFVLPWYRRCFRLERFQLGRLQYEIRPWTGPGYGSWLQEGEMAFWCHIPSSGPCTPEMVLDSLKQAYDFYNIKGTFAVGCKSWMLYPPHFPLFKPGSNLDAFHRLFTVFDKKERENEDLWRIFGFRDVVDLAALPEETSLQRSFAPWLRQGNKMGIGTGILLFDGKKIINGEGSI